MVLPLLLSSMKSTSLPFPLSELNPPQPFIQFGQRERVLISWYWLGIGVGVGIDGGVGIVVGVVIGVGVCVGIDEGPGKICGRWGWPRLNVSRILT